jgi:hypothetical protein
MSPSRERVGGCRASIVPLTGLFHQRFDETAAGAAVASGSAHALDLGDGPGSGGDGGLDGMIGHSEAETEDHRQDLPRSVGVVIRAPFRSFLGP